MAVVPLNCRNEDAVIEAAKTLVAEFGALFLGANRPAPFTGGAHGFVEKYQREFCKYACAIRVPDDVFGQIVTPGYWAPASAVAGVFANGFPKVNPRTVFDVAEVNNIVTWVKAPSPAGNVFRRFGGFLKPDGTEANLEFKVACNQPVAPGEYPRTAVLNVHMTRFNSATEEVVAELSAISL
jgi:hypothetical protein